MNAEQALEVVERDLLSRPFSPIERLVFSQSWHGQDYKDIAQNSGYGNNYIKEIGSQLWKELSEALGKRVTKKKLHLVLKAHFELNQSGQNQTNEQPSLEQQKCPSPTEIEEIFSSPTTQTKPEFPSGPLPFDSPLYIKRPPVEELVGVEITQPGCVVRVKAPKMMGKSSLLNWIIAHGTEQGYGIVYLDFLEADKTVFVSLDKFLRWFCVNVSRQLNLTPRLEDYWDEEMGIKVSCKIYFQGYLLEQVDRPFILALNEVNQVFEHPSIAKEFLPMLRFWHEQAKQVRVWQKLRLVLAHSTEIYVPLNLSQSPFNVGLTITLPPLSLDQIQDLAQRYGLRWHNEIGIRQAMRLQTMVGGHPYLVSVALYHLSQGNMTIEQLLRLAPTQAGIYSDHLRGYLTLLQNQPELAFGLQQVVMAEQGVQLGAIAAYKLESMGLIQLDGNWAQPSCELYRLYFREQLGEKNGSEALNQETGERSTNHTEGVV